MTTADDALRVRSYTSADIDAAVGVLARGMRDNPLHVAAYGADPEQRLRRHARLMRGVLTVFDQTAAICAVRDGQVVGVTGVAPLRACQPSPIQRLRLLPALARMGPRASVRVLRWTSAWAHRDPAWPHVHLGPLAVDAGMQGRGIGSAIMTELCRRLDRVGAASYLETDKPENVVFYRGFGFEPVGQENVLGQATWYMKRSAI